MSLKLYISNHIENLARRFSEHIKDNSDCFASELIVTQTSGMERWLALQVAQNNGVFAHFQFIKPTSFINHLYELSDIEVDSLYNTENLKWMLFRFFKEDEFVKRFNHVAQYYQNDDIKRLQLAVKVSDLFDQYLLYRQNYIEAWNRGELAKVIRQKDDTEKQYKNRQALLDKHQDWQFWLWRRIKSEIPKEHYDKVQLRDLLIRKIEEPDFQEKLKNQYGQISLFGLSVITDYHIKIFHRLSDFMTVNLYFLNPAPETYWYDIVSQKFVYYIEKKTGENIETLKLHVGNELLSNYSALAKDTYNILFREDDFVNAIDDSLCKEPLSNTLLEKIQHDIFNNLNQKRNRISLDNLKDESLIISSSYTPMREVEVLYNRILFVLDKNPDLQAQDIIVQLSDVDLYTPYIRAVFDNAPYSLPYSIADRSYLGGDTIVGILKLLLQLTSEDFTSEKVIQLLNFEWIRNRFDIKNVELIREVVREANIRFGTKGYATDDTRYVSWNYGLERVLLGYAIRSEEEYELEEYTTYPLDKIEGSDAEELLRFKAFVDRLILLINKRTPDRLLSGWKDYVEELIEQLLMVDKDAEPELKYIQQHLASFENMNSWLDEPIAYDVFQKAFVDALFSNSRAGHFISGGITFCSMIPMRSIPFRFVAMLGLNGDKFPRTDTKIAFDLINVEYQRGDRNTRNNDKYLFLETILSAKQYLYLSYIGNSTKDNSVYNPSLLIDELKTYIESACDKFPAQKSIDDYLLQRHPLHSFSQKYFDKSSPLFTYVSDHESVEISSDIQDSKEQDESAKFSSVNLHDLIVFFSDPFKYYYNKVLQIYYQEEDTLLPEVEIFEVDYLQQYSIKQELFNTNLPFEKYVEKAKKIGRLPLANIAPTVVKSISKEIENIKKQYLELTHKREAQHIKMELPLDGILLQSSVYPVYNQNYIYANVSNSSSRAKHLLKVWLTHLVLMANKQAIDTVFIAKYYEEPLQLSQSILTAKEAKDRLQKLVEIYLQGQKEIVAFEPNIGLELSYNLRKNEGNEAKIKESLQKAFKKLHELDSPNYTTGFYNLYIEKESEIGFFENDETVKNNLEDISHLIYSDLIESL